MLLTDLVTLLKAVPMTSKDGADTVIDNAGASDLMSDVLAFTKPGSVLLTGLCSPQVIRTAEMLDLKAIIFVRNKRPDASAVALAEEMGLPLFTSPYPLYEACGMLFKAGMPGCLDARDPHDHWAIISNERSGQASAPEPGKSEVRV